MTTRVTHRSIQESTLAHLQGNLASMAKLQEQVSSGKRITKPSDDPSGTVSSLALRQQLRLNEQYDRSAQDGLSWLATEDTALQTASSQLNAARTLVVKALNSGTSGEGSRAAIAVEVQGIAQTVLSLANTQWTGRNVFAGNSGATRAVTAPAAGSTPGSDYTWANSGGSVERQVDATSSVPVDSDGEQVFSYSYQDGSATRTSTVFSLLDEIVAKIKEDPNASPPATVATQSGRSLSDLLGDLDSALGNVRTGLSEVGARTNRITQAQSVAADAKINLTSRLSDVEDTDVPSAIINLQLQSTAYQAALTASSKVLQTSLMDFLR